MRKIERLMNAAIAQRKSWRLNNTSVYYEEGNEISRVYLFGNLIAEIGNNFVKLYDGGRRSMTTKSRLNSILRENGIGNEVVFQKDRVWFISYDNKTEEFVSGMTI